MEYPLAYGALVHKDITQVSIIRLSFFLKKKVNNYINLVNAIQCLKKMYFNIFRLHIF